MAIYAVGDLQGCYTAFQRLLDKVQFSPEQDTLWLAGDLVSRGKQSLEVLRAVKDLGDAAVVVLGNHDISLIAAHYGVVKAHSSLQPVMKAPDREELIEWLRFRPILHVDSELGYCMAHAGVYPLWNLNQAQQFAREIEVPIRGATIKRWLKNVYGDKPELWNESLKSYDRHRFILNAFTRMRGCQQNGGLNYSVKGTASDHQAAGLYPWFQVPQRVLLPYKVVFGHWSAMGFYENNQVVSLDTGCVWGGKLTAVRLDSDIIQPIQVACK